MSKKLLFIWLFILFLFIDKSFYSLAPFRIQMTLEQNVIDAHFKKVQPEEDMQELKKHPISPQVIDFLNTHFFVPTHIFTFFNYTFIGDEPLPINNRNSRRVNCAWLYTMMATSSFNFDALYFGSTLLSSCYNRFLITELTDVHSFFRPLQTLIDWGADLTQSSFLGSPLDIAGARLEDLHRMEMRQWLLEESDLNSRLLAIRPATIGQAETAHLAALNHIEKIQHGFKSSLEVLIELSSMYSIDHEKALVLIISLSDLTERSSFLGNTPLMLFLEKIRFLDISFNHISPILHAFLMHKAPLFQQNNEGETPFSLVQNKLWKNKELANNILNTFKKHLEEEPALPYHHLLQNFRGTLGYPDPTEQISLKTSREPSILKSSPFFKPEYAGNNNFLNFMSTLDDMMEFFLNVSCICPVIHTSKNQMRQQHIVTRLTDILLSQVHWLDSFSPDTFMSIYKQNTIPYDALVWLSIAVLQRDSVTTQQMTFFTSILQKVKELEKEGLLSPQAQLYLSLLSDINNGRLDANNNIQAIQDGHNVFIMILIINEKEALEVLKKWIQKGVPLPLYNPRNIIERATFLALQQKCSAPYGRKMNPIYTSTLDALKKEKLQLEQNILSVQSLDDIILLMHTTWKNHQQCETSIEGRSLYLESQQGQVVVKFQTNSDDENGFLDGALINFGHNQQLTPLTNNYSKACLIQLPEDLFQKIESQIKQQDKFKKARIDNKAVVFLHPNYQDRILKKRPSLSMELNEPFEALDSFSLQLQKNLNDFFELANKGVFLHELSSYSHGFGLDGEIRNVDEAVYLDLIDTRNHGKGTIVDLIDGMKDSNFGVHGFVDPGNLLTLGVKTENYTLDNKILFQTTSEQERKRLSTIVYSKALMGYLQNAYMAWLVFLSEQPEMTYNITPSQFSKHVFHTIVQPFLDKMTPTMNTPAFQKYVFELLFPLLEEDFKYFKRFRDNFSQPIIRENIRDFCLQNFFTGCSFLVSLASLETLHPEIHPPSSLVLPSDSHLFPNPSFRRLKNREQFIQLINKKDFQGIYDDQDNFIEEAFYLKEYFLLHRNNEALFFLIENTPRLFEHLSNFPAHSNLYRTLFIWQKELLLDAITFNNLDVIKSLYLQEKHLFPELLGEIIATIVQTQNRCILNYLSENAPHLFDDIELKSCFLMTDEFQHLFPHLDIDFCQFLFHQFTLFKNMDPGLILQIITTFFNLQQFNDFLKDEQIHQAFIKYTVDLPQLVQTNIYSCYRLLSFDIVNTCFLQKEFEDRTELLSLVQLLVSENYDSLLLKLEPFFLDSSNGQNVNLDEDDLEDQEESLTSLYFLEEFFQWTDFDQFVFYLPSILKLINENYTFSFPINEDTRLSEELYKKLDYALQYSPFVRIADIRSFEMDEGTEIDLSLYNYSDKITLHLVHFHLDFHESLEYLLCCWTPPPHLLDSIVDLALSSPHSRGLWHTPPEFFEHLFLRLLSVCFDGSDLPSSELVNRMFFYHQQITERYHAPCPLETYSPPILTPEQTSLFLSHFPEQYLWKHYEGIYYFESRKCLVQHALQQQTFSLKELETVFREKDISILTYIFRHNKDPQIASFTRKFLYELSYEIIFEEIQGLRLSDGQFDFQPIIHQFLSVVFSSSVTLNSFLKPLNLLGNPTNFQAVDQDNYLLYSISLLNEEGIFLDFQELPTDLKIPQLYTVSLFDYLSFLFFETELSYQAVDVTQLAVFKPIIEHLDSILQKFLDSLSKQHQQELSEELGFLQEQFSPSFFETIMNQLLFEGQLTSSQKSILQGLCSDCQDLALFSPFLNRPYLISASQKALFMAS